MVPEHYRITALSCKAEPAVLDDSATVKACIAALVEAGGYTQLDEVSYEFRPHGVTAVALLSESHIAIHTWPEQSTAKIVIATCRESSQTATYTEVIAAILDAREITVQEMTNV